MSPFCYIAFGYRRVARYYESAIGRFTRVDPHAEKYFSWSPYVYVGNNPIIRTDPTGMDWYIFDEKTGEYKEKQSAEEKHRMAVSRSDKNGNVTYKFYDFNDSRDDVKNIENGNINRYSSLSSESIESIMKESGVYDQSSLSRWEYIVRESNAGNIDGGKLDFRVTVPNLWDTKALQLINGTAYNSSDAGNYLWGYAMRKLGFEELTARTGAHVNAWWSAKQSNGDGSSHPNSVVHWFQNRSWGGDSAGDQRAIKKGMKDAGSFWENAWRVFKKNFK